MMDEKKKRMTFDPPDGGWGWMIVCGSALSHVFLIPTLQNFTLMFKERFIELDFTSTDITTVVSLNASFGMILGITSGPLLKLFGYRKIALVGGTLYVIGLLCTGIAKSYFEIIIYYGLLSSLGMAQTMASFSLAVNSYFLKNRSKAVGFTMTLTGLGPVILPFVISKLLSSYGLKWTVFILSGLSLHVYPAALLLHPVKWHLKISNFGTSLLQEKDKQILISEANSFLEMSILGSKMSLPSHFRSSLSSGVFLKGSGEQQRDLPEPCPKEMINDLKYGRKLSVTCLDNDDYCTMMASTLGMMEKMEKEKMTSKKNFMYASAETLTNQDYDKGALELLQSETETGAVYEERAERGGLLLRFIHFLKDIYDLDLLRDLRYINTMIGLSLAFVGEVMFSTMTPIILREVGFGTEDTAVFMSIIAGCDLLCRFIAPFVGRKSKLSSKTMYLIALSMLLLSRLSMYLASSRESYLLVSLALGIGKGFRSVYWVLVLPDCVPLSKLPSASAFHSLINGVLILISGPLMGSIVALTNRYSSIIVISNVLTMATILLWCGELIFLRWKKNKTCIKELLRF